jgi:hypothetical protein
MSAATHPQFDVELSAAALGPNLPQRIGRLLWAPMLVMGLMAFPIGLAVAVVRAGAVADGQLGPAAMFIGFAAVFAAISFAIARILGEMRLGGGRIQEAAGRTVHTLRMPLTGYAFLGAMAMGMMLILGGVVGHLVVGAGILGGNATLLAQEESWGIWLEAVRRMGVVAYLVAIALGLGTIVTVLRFQATRVRELAVEPIR